MILAGLLALVLCSACDAFTPIVASSFAQTHLHRRSSLLWKILNQQSHYSSPLLTKMSLSSSASIGLEDPDNASDDTELAADDGDDDGDVVVVQEDTRAVIARRVLGFVALSFGIFTLGYRFGLGQFGVGVGAAAGTTAGTAAAAATRASRVAAVANHAESTMTNISVRRASPRLIFLAAMGVGLLLREMWRAVPTWIKPHLFRNLSTQQQRRRRRPITKASLKHDDAAMNDDDDDGNMFVDTNDISDVRNIAMKLRNLFQSAETKLNYDFDMGPPLMAMLQLLSQLDQEQIELRRTYFQESGKPGTAEDLDGLAEAFEFADFAYDECPSGMTLEENLNEMGFSLIRHDTTLFPGKVGHYIAISKERKLALIGIKGTSGLEDLLTDCCGLAVTHTLEDGPFVPGGKTEIQCHEGVLISATRLANDVQPIVEELLLPSGYKILVVGHSLGAAGASLIGVILRSRIPALLADSKGERLKVLAFASPPVLDYENAKACASFTTTIVNNLDVVTRSSLANLLITARTLKEVNDKLKEKGLDSTVSLLRKLAKGGNDPELLMEFDELRAIVDRSVADVELNDPDHLYVPGKVVIMYHDGELEPNDDDDTNEDAKILSDEDRMVYSFVLASDGAADVLRMLQLNSRMLSDHMAPAYRSSLKALTNLPSSSAR